MFFSFTKILNKPNIYIRWYIVRITYASADACHTACIQAMATMDESSALRWTDLVSKTLQRVFPGFLGEGFCYQT